MNWLLTLLLGSNAFQPTEQYVDMIELHHKMVGDTCVYTQVIAWDRRKQDGKYEVRAWGMVDYRLVDKGLPEQRGPLVYWRAYGKHGPITLRSGLYRVSFLSFDPESENRKTLPTHLRVDLASEKFVPLPEESE